MGDKQGSKDWLNLGTGTRTDPESGGVAWRRGRDARTNGLTLSKWREYLFCSHMQVDDARSITRTS
jgi:hypothetical protein